MSSLISNELISWEKPITWLPLFLGSRAWKHANSKYIFEVSNILVVVDHLEPNYDKGRLSKLGFY